MGARTGEEFLKGLQGAQARGVARRRARRRRRRTIPRSPAPRTRSPTVFDRQHEYADDCLMPDPETGEPINVSHMIPRSVDDLQRRHRGLVRIAEATVGPHGPHARLHERHVRRLRGRAERVARSRRPQRGGRATTSCLPEASCAREDISLTHTIVHPTIDRATDTVVRRQPGAAAQGRPTPSTASSCAGARILATLAPFADEIAVYPGHPLPPDAPTAYALSFSIPMDTPGLIFLCRDSASTPGRRSVRPSALHPLRRAGRLRDLRRRRGARATACSSTATTTSTTRCMLPTAWWANIMQQTTIRALDEARVRLRPGAARMAEAVNDATPQTLEMLGELHGYVEVTRSAVLLAEEHAYDRGDGVVVPRRPAAAPDAGACWPSGSRGSTRSSSRSAATTCSPRRAGRCSTTPASGR